MLEVRKERFSMAVEQVLRQAGWSPGRRVSDDAMRHWLAIEWNKPFYQVIFPAAYSVLREFGGLHITFLFHTPDPDFQPFDIAPRTAAAELDAETCVYYEWWLNERLFPLGVQQDDVLMIGLQGRMYQLCNVSGEILVLGENFDQALESLIMRRPSLRLPRPTRAEEADMIVEALGTLRLRN
jgi:hypothetical protein